MWPVFLQVQWVTWGDAIGNVVRGYSTRQWLLRIAALFAEYKILAVSGLLSKTINVKPIGQTDACLRTSFP